MMGGGGISTGLGSSSRALRRLGLGFSTVSPLANSRKFVKVAYTGCLVPPKHPRGVPWKTALKGLDWVGALLFTPGAVMILGEFDPFCLNDFPFC